MIRSLIIILFLTWGAPLFAITPKSVIEKVQQTYEASEYSFKSTFDVFMGHHAMNVHESYSGVTIKGEQGTYQKIADLEWINTNSFALQIVADNKVMYLKSDSKIMNQTFDVKSILFNSKGLEMDETDSHFQIHIKYFENGISPYSQIDLMVDKTTYFVKELHLFCSTEKSFMSNGVEVLAKPRIDITFSELDTSETDQRESLFEINYYINNSNSIGITPTERFDGFQVYDLRTK